MYVYVEPCLHTDKLVCISNDGVISTVPSPDFKIMDSLIADLGFGVDVASSNYNDLWLRLNKDYPTIISAFMYEEEMLITTETKVENKPSFDRRAYVAELLDVLDKKILSASPTRKSDLTSKRDLIASIM